MRALSSVFLIKFSYDKVKSSDSENLEGALCLIPKWQPINNYSFVCIN